MIDKLNQFLQWLEISRGSYKGQPIPNYVFLLLIIFIFIYIIIIIFNKIKKYKIDFKNIDVLYDKTLSHSNDQNFNPEMELSYGDFLNRNAITSNQIEGE